MRRDQKAKDDGRQVGVLVVERRGSTEGAEGHRALDRGRLRATRDVAEVRFDESPGFRGLEVPDDHQRGVVGRVVEGNQEIDV